MTQVFVRVLPQQRETNVTYVSTAITSLSQAVSVSV